MRIIGGRFRGRRLVAPSGKEVRPTGDRAREALMSVLEHGSPPLQGSRFLDVFAGTGAVGIEAWSRGASSVWLIEHASAAQSSIERNLATLPDSADLRLLAADATRLPVAPHPFDIVFLDPPYGSALAEAAWIELSRRSWIREQTRVVLEANRGAIRPELPNIAWEDVRRYGAAILLFGRVSGSAGAAKGIARPVLQEAGEQ